MRNSRALSTSFARESESNKKDRRPKVGGGLFGDLG
jgi:hypothetical protein